MRDGCDGQRVPVKRLLHDTRVVFNETVDAVVVGVGWGWGRWVRRVFRCGVSQDCWPVVGWVSLTNSITRLLFTTTGIRDGPTITDSVRAKGDVRYQNLRDELLVCLW